MQNPIPEKGWADQDPEDLVKYVQQATSMFCLKQKAINQKNFKGIGNRLPNAWDCRGG